MATLRPGLLIVFERSSEWCVLLDRADLIENINDWECSPTGEMDMPPWPKGEDGEHTWVWNCMWGSPPGPAHYASLGDMGYGITETTLHTILAHTGSWTLEGDTLTVHEWRLIDEHDWKR